MSSVAVHIFVIFHIIAGSHIVHPVLMVEIPSDSLFDAFLKLKGRLPAEFPVQLGRIYRIPHVMSLAVGHICDQAEGMPLRLSEKTVYSTDYHLDDINVLPLVESAYIVGFRNLPLMENEVYRPCMSST